MKRKIAFAALTATTAVIADLNVRTARILKRIMPGCRLHGLSLASNKPEVFEACLAEIVKIGGQDLFDTYIYHGYAYNPDSSYERVEKLIEICARLAPKAKMRQGENGCISEWMADGCVWRFGDVDWKWRGGTRPGSADARILV